jgi:UDP-glucose 4-epimerase
MNFFVTGGAGFIGSTFCDYLLSKNHHVTIYDNFSTGKKNFISQALNNPNCTLIEGDLLDEKSLKDSIKNHDVVAHFAANADVRYGVENTKKDLEQNTIATSNVLDVMRENNIKKILFSSTGSIYGEAKTIPTPEDYQMPIQTSLYGASKLACESLIQAYCEAFDIQSWIFRFVSILGERYTHGHVYDFYNSLSKNKDNLKVLGDGEQKKSYLYVQDCIEYMYWSIEKTNDKVNIFNLGTNEYITVKESINFICNEMGVNPKLELTGGDKGWVGDNPFIWLDCSKIFEICGKPKVSIKDGVKKTVNWLDQNQWVFEDDNNT